MVGNRKERVEDGVATDYEYDDTYQLTKAQTGPRKERYEYDDVGNRTFGPTVKDVTGSYAHDDANRMTEGRKLDYAYDDLGRQTERRFTADKKWLQYWDGEGQLKKVELMEGAEIHRRVTFKYDPFGRRVEKKTAYSPDATPETVVTTYVYDREDIIYTETDVEGVVSKTHYIHGPGIGEPLAMVRDGAAYYYHADGLGNIVAITDANMQVVQRYSYESFGRVKASDRSFKNIYTYTGREWDSEIGLHYYRARYYDPMGGRFISKDPIGFSGGDVNLYGYVGNSPVVWVDPYGLSGSGINWGASLNKSPIKFPLIYNFIDPPEATTDSPLTDPNIASNFLPIGSVGKITGFTKHGINQAICRDGVGVASKEMLKAVKDPTKIVEQTKGAMKYIGENATVVLNKAGKVITTWSRNASGWRMQP